MSGSESWSSKKKSIIWHIGMAHDEQRQHGVSVYFSSYNYTYIQCRRALYACVERERKSASALAHKTYILHF